MTLSMILLHLDSVINKCVISSYLYDVEYGRVVESFRAHDDSVSCLLWLEKGRYPLRV